MKGEEWLHFDNLAGPIEMGGCKVSGCADWLGQASGSSDAAFVAGSLVGASLEGLSNRPIRYDHSVSQSGIVTVAVCFERG